LAQKVTVYRVYIKICLQQTKLVSATVAADTEKINLPTLDFKMFST